MRAYCAPPEPATDNTSWIITRGGGGGIQNWFRRGCAAEAAKPVPIFKGHFGGKGYPLLGVWRKRVPIIRVFFKKMTFLCTLATKWTKISSIYSKITKVGGMFRDFFRQKWGACLGIFFEKSHAFQLHTPVHHIRRVPPPPPG